MEQVWHSVIWITKIEKWQKIEIHKMFTNVGYEIHKLHIKKVKNDNKKKTDLKYENYTSKNPWMRKMKKINLIFENYT